MSSDIDLPLTRRHDQVSANAAHSSVPGNVYSHVNVAAGGRSHLGNCYNFGPTEDQQILQSILQSLYYPEMGQRGRDVPDAGAGTFEWLFEDFDSPTSRDSNEYGQDEAGLMGNIGEVDEKAEEVDDGENEQDVNQDQQVAERMDDEEDEARFEYWERRRKKEQHERNRMTAQLRYWLKTDGDAVFWVMKFLRDNDGTDTLLREWAVDDLLIVADHFFWLPGTHLQNSFEGLARSLMHAILSSLTADITSAKSICGKRRWSMNTSNRPWSKSEFKRMFSNLGNIRGIRVFILVDGLD
jgi:hypothetical protein